LRLINNEPMMLENCTLPLYRFNDFEKFDLEKRSVYEIFKTEYGVVAHHSHQSLEAVNADEYESKLLNVPPGAALILERRLAFDKDNKPIELGHDLYRGDRFRFVTEVAPLAFK